jgi:hypothetical protein
LFQVRRYIYEINLIEGREMKLGGLGAWHAKFETMSQLSPIIPAALNPMQSPSFAGVFWGTIAAAKSLSQLDPSPPRLLIEVCSMLEEIP